jgi:1,4-alpha-glucan branching enzyme
MGAQRIHEGADGTHFAVWAPNARYVSVIGDFNGWEKGSHPMTVRGNSGIWEIFVPGVRKGVHYKYHVASASHGYAADKADPFAFHAETPPGTASIVWDLDYAWGDAEWMDRRADRNARGAPISIYEVHLGSWRRVPEESNRPLTYREMAAQLPAYARELNFTHVELLPVMEHPFFGSWGYQTTGYFAPTSRYGTPQDLMFLIDSLHREGLGVILDWVPSHFPSDEHGLGYFDGTHLYEHADSRQGFHPEWKSLIFNYGRNEVRSFLLSSALYWLEAFHADGLRVDAVASMLYLDYGRTPGEWIPNVFGERGNLEAMSLLRRVNEEVYARQAGAQTYAEESTSWPMVTRPVSDGGLGFGFKWDMGWMHDSLAYFKREPIHRRFHHNEMTFRMLYALTENFVLPLSHDEVVHLKGSLLSRMPGDDWQKFANLRLLLAWMWAQAGKKLLFMGGEIGQWREWNHDASLDWHLLGDPQHSGVQRWVADLNRACREEKALHELDCEPGGFEWIFADDADNGVLTLLRRGRSEDEIVLIALNLTPVPRSGYRVGVPNAGTWRVLLDGDRPAYGGSGWSRQGEVSSEEHGSHGRPFSLLLDLPPLGALFLKGPGRQGEPATAQEPPEEPAT